jgi:hypothetical protein
MIQGSTQPLTELSTKNPPGNDKADNFAVYELIVLNVWDPRRHTTRKASTAC